MKLKKGVCRICGCTQQKGCNVPIPSSQMYGSNPIYLHRLCGWLDKSKTICDNPDCVQKYKQEHRAHLLGDALRHHQIWIQQRNIQTWEENDNITAGYGPDFEKEKKQAIRTAKKEIKRLERLTVEGCKKLYQEHLDANS